MSADEVRTVSSTGGEKGVKLARFDLIPWDIIRELAEHFGRGARKYADRNWERGYEWSKSFGALHRHLEAFWARDEIDDDPSLYLDGEPHVVRHIIAVVWHACVLAWYSRYGKGIDDRPAPFTHDDEPPCEVLPPRRHMNKVDYHEYVMRVRAAAQRSPAAGPESWRTQALVEMRLAATQRAGGYDQ